MTSPLDPIGRLKDILLRANATLRPNDPDPWRTLAQAAYPEIYVKKLPVPKPPPPRVPPHISHQLLSEVAGLLGLQCSPGSDYGRRALWLLSRRVREGATLPDLRQVCVWARARWDGGERWAQLRNLLYLWGAAFPSVLAAGPPKPAPGRRGAPRFRTEADRQAWEAGVRVGPALPPAGWLEGPTPWDAI